MEQESPITDAFIGPANQIEKLSAGFDQQSLIELNRVLLRMLKTRTTETLLEQVLQYLIDTVNAPDETSIKIRLSDTQLSHGVHQDGSLSTENSTISSTFSSMIYDDNKECGIITLDRPHLSSDSEPDDRKQCQLACALCSAWLEKARPSEDDLIKDDIISGSSDLIAFVDTNFRYRFVNSVYSRVFAKPVDEIVGEPVKTVIGKQFFEETVKPMLLQCFAGETVQYQTSYMSAQGEVDADVIYSPRYSPSRQVIGAIIMVRDISSLMNAKHSLERSEARFRDLANNIPGAIFQYKIKPDGTDDIEYMSDGCTDLWECTSEELQNDPTKLWEMVVPEDLEGLQRSVQESMQAMKGWEHEWQIVTPSNTKKYLRGKGAPKLLKDGSVFWNSLIIDQSKERQQQEKLIQSEVVFSSTSEAICITDRAGFILEINDAFKLMTGYERSDILGQTPDSIRSDQAWNPLYQTLWDTLREFGSWRGEITNRRQDGSLCPCLLTANAVTNTKGNRTGYVWVYSDITFIKETEARLDFIAHHDALTKLPNRRYFKNALEESISTAEQDNLTLAVAFIDLDRFKTINDSLGHEVGDAVLMESAKRLQQIVNSEDLIARISGDEFILLLNNAKTEQEIGSIIENMITLLRQPINYNSYEISITASIGIAMYPRDGRTAAELIRNADSAMYHAKQDGCSTFKFYSIELTKSAYEQVYLTNALRAAMDNSEFKTLYQPQLDLKTGKITGLEILIRWEHPQLGKIPPQKFIPVAEQTGLIRDIGAWILNEACLQGKQWLDQGFDYGHISVNVSGKQFIRDDFVRILQTALIESSLPAKYLELEITENVLMDSVADSIRQLNVIRDMGVGISIDDFGTGYSSLSSLKKLPLTRLKVDRSFVMDIPADKNDVAITEAVIAMSKALGLKVLAEGVETQAQVNFLKALSCDEVQGFYYSEPISADDVVANY